jgi:hypothetical protein
LLATGQRPDSTNLYAAIQHRLADASAGVADNCSSIGRILTHLRPRSIDSRVEQLAGAIVHPSRALAGEATYPCTNEFTSNLHGK